MTCCAITAPIECTKESTQTEQTSVVGATKTSNFNLDEAVKKTPESKVLAKLEDNFNENNASSLIALNNQSIKELKGEKIVQQDAIKNVKEIYAGKINPQLKLKELKNEFDAKHSQKELNYLQSKINDKKHQIEAQRKLQFKEIELRNLQNSTSLFYFRPNIASTMQNADAKLSSLESELSNAKNEMKTFACLSTVASIASAAVAIAIWAIPFFGWFEEGFAIADTVIDTAAAATAWSAYYEINFNNNKAENLIYRFTLGFNASTGVCLGVDLGDIVHTICHINPILNTVSAMATTDAATNAAGATAEPEVATWYNAGICALAFVIDSVSITVGIMDQFLPQTISQLQQEISEKEK